MEHQAEVQDYFAEIRWLQKGLVDISFVDGSPGTETLTSCSDMMLDASQSLLSKDVDIDGLFKYGISGGETKFLQQLSQFLSQEYGDNVKCSDLMVNAGATQGLHTVLSLLCQQSSPVFVEDPSYFYGFRMIRDDLQMNLVPVPSYKDGINTDALDKLLTSHKTSASSVLTGNRYWASIYLVPVFGNPTGWTYSIDCCKKLVQLARKHDVLLIAEDVYNLLYFTDASHAPPRLISFDKKTDPDYGRGHVISNGTFSKILAPSLRLGWIEGSKEMISTLKESNLANSGGCFNHYTSLLVRSILSTGVLLQHTKFLRETYKKRMDILCAVLDENLPEGCSYVKPEGGFFLWLNFRPDIDALQFNRFAIEKYSISFLPGVCSSPTGSFRNCARLSISSRSQEFISEGAKKLCQAYKEFTSTLEKS